LVGRLLARSSGPELLFCLPAFAARLWFDGGNLRRLTVVARSVEELAEILQRLSMFGDSSTSVVLETIIPLRNPIPAPKPEAVAKRSAGAVRLARSGGNGSLEELP
jgi:hypothetical protein